MATLAQHIEARNDDDLLARFVAAAEQNGVPFPQNWVGQNIGSLVAAEIGDTTVADVHAYAVASYEPTPRPGADASKVTDSQVISAVEAIWAEQNPTPPSE